VEVDVEAASFGGGQPKLDEDGVGAVYSTEYEDLGRRLAEPNV